MYENGGIGKVLLTCDAMEHLLLEAGRQTCAAVIKDIGAKLLSNEGKEYLRIEEDMLSACTILRSYKRMNAKEVFEFQTTLLVCPDRFVPQFAAQQGTIPNGLRHEVSYHYVVNPETKQKFVFWDYYYNEEEEVIL